MRAQLRKLVWASGVTVIEVKESDREASCATAASNAIVVTVQSHGAGKAAGVRNGKVHRLGFSNGASHRGCRLAAFVLLPDIVGKAFGTR